MKATPHIEVREEGVIAKTVLDRSAGPCWDRKTKPRFRGFTPG